MTSFPSVEIVAGGAGVLQFQVNTTNASGGYGIYRTAGGHLQFQGGSSGYQFMNDANTADLLHLMPGGDVGIGIPLGTSPLVSRLDIRGAVGQWETLSLAGDSQSTITLRNKATPAQTAAVISSNYGGGTTTSTTRLEAAGGFALGVGVTSFHAGQRVVLNVPNAGNDGWVQVRAPGDGAVLLQLQSSTAVNQLGMYAAVGTGDVRIGARGTMTLHAGNANYTAQNEVVRLLANGNAGVGVTAPQARLDVGVPGGPQSAIHITSQGAGDGDLPALRWRNAAGHDKLEIWTSLGATPTARIKAAGTLALHAGNVGFTDINEFLTILINGNVGIGNTAPGDRLVVNGTVNASVGFTVAGQCYVGGAGTPGRISSNDFRFLSSGSSAGLFNSSGTRRLVGNDGCYYA